MPMNRWIVAGALVAAMAAGVELVTGPAMALVKAPKFQVIAPVAPAAGVFAPAGVV